MEIVGTSITRGEAITSPVLNDRIRRDTRASVAYYASHPEEIDARLEELDREWGVERWLQLNSSVLSLFGLVLGAAWSRKWLAVPAVVQTFFMQHGIQGWCPPLPVFRRLGIRTLGEIQAERHALKALRGDFANAGKGKDASAALRAASLDGGAGAAATSGGSFVKPSVKRVPENTAAPVNEQIRRETERRVAFYAAHPELRDKRLAELDREWDVERVMEVEAPSMTLTGVFLGAFVNRKWLAIPIFAQSMMLVHAVQGFYPLLPLFRRMRLRTEQEIGTERYALKALRGDFERLNGEVSAQRSPAERADQAFDAAQPVQQ